MQQNDIKMASFWEILCTKNLRGGYVRFFFFFKIYPNIFIFDISELTWGLWNLHCDISKLNDIYFQFFSSPFNTMLFWKYNYYLFIFICFFFLIYFLFYIQRNY
jgi:hypothetical protein